MYKPSCRYVVYAFRHCHEHNYCGPIDAMRQLGLLITLIPLCSQVIISPVCRHSILFTSLMSEGRVTKLRHVQEENIRLICDNNSKPYRCLLSGIKVCVSFRYCEVYRSQMLFMFLTTVSKIFLHLVIFAKKVSCMTPK